MPIYKGACPHDCPDTCAWQVSVDADGRVTDFSGDPAHPFTAGALCSKLKRYPDRVASPDRILHPLRRVGPKGSGQFEQVSWDEAIGEATDRLRSAVDEYGPLTALPCSFAGTLGLLNRYAGERFFARLGASGFNVQICGDVGYDAIRATLGSGETMDPEDLLESRYIIIWGANPAVTNVHLWGGFIVKARRRGAKIVVIDPVRTQTAAHSDWHLRPRPGTDAALALGMIHVLIRDGLIDEDYVRQHTLGFDALAERAAAFPPERVATITGIDPQSIEKLAREYATTPPAAIKVTVGMERHEKGFMSFRAVSCLPALVGAWKRIGGGLFHATVDAFFEAVDYGAVFPPPECEPPGRAIHAAALGQALTDRTAAPPVKWLLVHSFNPLVSLPNQNLLRAGLMRDDLFTVVHEQFMTDTARHADIILPATMQFEHWDLMPSWGHFYIALNTPALEPRGECVSNTELFRRLSRAMDFHEPWLHESDEEKIRALLASGNPLLDGISFDLLQRQGWARLNVERSRLSRAHGGFTTPSGLCEFYSESLREEGYEPLPDYVPPDNGESRSGTYPLELITPKAPHFLNSEYVNLPHRGTAKLRPEIQINPEDAQARAINTGDRVRLHNELGAVEVFARVSGDTDPGVLCCPFNWWTTSTLNDVSLGALTPDGLSDRGFGSNAYDAWVEVEAVDR